VITRRQEWQDRLSPSAFAEFVEALETLCVAHRVRIESHGGQVPRVFVELSDRPGFDRDDIRNGDEP
jgi:hypothetical protein